MMKKLACFFLTIIMVFSMTTTVSAEEYEEVILDTHFYSFSANSMMNSTNSGIQPRVDEYNFGDIRIDDILGATSGKIRADRKELIGTAAKNTAMIIISAIPGVGNVVSPICDVIELAMSYSAAMQTIDYTKAYEATTWYSYRNFTHRIMAYTPSRVWREVGTSLSRYYYKHTTASSYCYETGDYVTVSVDYTHSNGYDPACKAEAPNYKNYSVLSQYGYEAYVTNVPYREDYR